MTLIAEKLEGTKTATSLLNSRKQSRNSLRPSTVVKCSTKENLMSLSKKQVEVYRRKGIHLLKNDTDLEKDLRYTFSDFHTAKQAVNDKAKMMHTFYNTPVIGKDASTKGIGGMITGQTYDCKHLDSFVKSTSNF